MKNTNVHYITDKLLQAAASGMPPKALAAFVAVYVPIEKRERVLAVLLNAQDDLRATQLQEAL